MKGFSIRKFIGNMKEIENFTYFVEEIFILLPIICRIFGKTISVELTLQKKL